MALPYEAYITLLTDLLSPDELPQGTLASIAFQIGTLEDTGLVNLVSAILQSRSLFREDDPSQEASTSRRTASVLSFEPARDLFHAIRQGVLARIDKVKQRNGKGWSGRRKMYKDIQRLTEITSRQEHETLNLSGSFKHLTLAGGILRAMQDAADQKDSFVKVDSYAVCIAENTFISTLSRHVSLLPAAVTHELPQSDQTLSAWLVSQTLPNIPSDRLRLLASEPFFDFGFGYIRSCFMDGRLLQGLAQDVVDSNDGLQWKESSPSSQRLTEIKSSLAQSLLGRFSRSLGKVIESVASTSVYLLLLPHLERLETLAEQINGDWSNCPWSNANGPEFLHPDTRLRDEPWTLFKTLLFTLTMVFSSLISLVNAMPLSPNESPDRSVLELASCTLRTFSATYFITSQFGSAGFGAYQNVWYGAVDLVSRAKIQTVEQVVKSCEPRFEYSERRSDILKGTVSRSRLTYWLNLIEQLVPSLPDRYLGETVIPILRPYTSNKQDQQAFEAAHSVLLAIFTGRKSIAVDLSEWYCDLLLVAYPNILVISQLRLAFATMMACLADLDEVKTRICINKLEKAIETIPLGPSRQKSSDVPLAEISQGATTLAKKAQVSSDLTPKAMETAALESRRGHLLLILIDQLSTVDLGMMNELLDKARYFLQEERGAPESSRAALISVLYNTLSGSMDMVKRESAAKWWLEHRQAMEREENSSQDTARTHPKL